MQALSEKQEVMSLVLSLCAVTAGSPTPWMGLRQRICVTLKERNGNSGKPSATKEGEQKQDRRDQRHRAKYKVKKIDLRKPRRKTNKPSKLNSPSCPPFSSISLTPRYLGIFAQC